MGSIVVFEEHRGWSLMVEREVGKDNLMEWVVVGNLLLLRRRIAMVLKEHRYRRRSCWPFEQHAVA